MENRLQHREGFRPVTSERPDPAPLGSMRIPAGPPVFPVQSPASIGHKIPPGYRPEWPCHILCTCYLNLWLSFTNGMARKPYNSDSTADYQDEIANLLLYLVIRGYRLGDLLAQQATEALTQVVGRNVNGADADTTFGGQVRPRGVAVATGEETLKRLEELAFAGCGVFVPQFRHRPFQNGKGPTAFKDRLGCALVGRFERVARFRVRAGHRNERLATAPPLGVRPLAFVGEKVFQASQEEGTKLPGGGLHVPDGVAFEETEKEFLRGVFGFMGLEP